MRLIQLIVFLDITFLQEHEIINRTGKGNVILSSVFTEHMSGKMLDPNMSFKSRTDEYLVLLPRYEHHGRFTQFFFDEYAVSRSFLYTFEEDK